MKRTRNPFTRLLVFLLLVLSLVFSSTSCTIIDYVEQANAEYASDYFSEYIDLKFDDSKFREFERIYNKYYYLEIPEPEQMATLTAEVFINDYVSEIDTIDENAVTEALINAYIDVIGDKYSVYRSPVADKEYDDEMSGKFYGIGVAVVYHKQTESIYVDEVFYDGGAMNAGILVGDYITAINGVLVSDVGYDASLESIRGEEDSTVNLTIKRGDEVFSVDVIRGEIIESTVEYAIDKNKIGYIQITSFKDKTDEEFKMAIDYMKEAGAVGIIYDVRGNLGGYLASTVNALSYVAPSDVKLVSYSNNYRQPHYDNNSHSLKLPCVVIFNGRTASAGELFASTIKDIGEIYGCYDVTTVGEKSFGKGILQTRQTMSDGSSITLTAAYYTTPNGKNYHGVGLTPDITVSGADAQLERAYEEILKLIK